MIFGGHMPLVRYASRCEKLTWVKPELDHLTSARRCLALSCMWTLQSAILKACTWSPNDGTAALMSVLVLVWTISSSSRHIAELSLLVWLFKIIKISWNSKHLLRWRTHFSSSASDTLFYLKNHGHVAASSKQTIIQWHKLSQPSSGCEGFAIFPCEPWERWERWVFFSKSHTVDGSEIPNSHRLDV